MPCRGDSGSREEACPIEGPALSKVVEPSFGREVVVEVVEEVGPSTVFPVVHWDLQNPGEVLLQLVGIFWMHDDYVCSYPKLNIFL